MRTHTVLSDETVQRVYALKRQGKTSAEAARALGLPVATVQGKLKTLRLRGCLPADLLPPSWKMTVNGSPHDWTKLDPIIIECIQKGYGYKQTGGVIGIPPATTKNRVLYLRAHGFLEPLAMRPAHPPPPEAKPWERMGISRERYQEPLDKPLPPFHPIAREVLARAAALQIGVQP